MKYLHIYVREEYNKRSSQDRRKKVDWYLVEYLDELGVPYRKAFEFKIGTPYDEVKRAIPLSIK